MIPIQVTGDGVMIPLSYFQTRGLELVVEGEWAVVRPKQKVRPPRKPGSAVGLITVHPDFYDPLPDDVLALFE